MSSRMCRIQNSYPCRRWGHKDKKGAQNNASFDLAFLFLFFQLFLCQSRGERYLSVAEVRGVVTEEAVRGEGGLAGRAQPPGWLVSALVNALLVCGESCGGSPRQPRHQRHPRPVPRHPLKDQRSTGAAPALHHLAPHHALHHHALYVPNTTYPPQDAGKKTRTNLFASPDATDHKQHKQKKIEKMWIYEGLA